MKYPALFQEVGIKLAFIALMAGIIVSEYFIVIASIQPGIAAFQNYMGYLGILMLILIISIITWYEIEHNKVGRRAFWIRTGGILSIFSGFASLTVIFAFFVGVLAPIGSTIILVQYIRHINRKSADDLLTEVIKQERKKK